MTLCPSSLSVSVSLQVFLFSMTVRTIIKDRYPYLCMLDGTSVLRVNSPLVGTIYSQSNKFVMGVKIKATADSKLNDNLVQ